MKFFLFSGFAILIFLNVYCSAKENSVRLESRTSNRIANDHNLNDERFDNIRSERKKLEERREDQRLQDYRRENLGKIKNDNFNKYSLEQTVLNELGNRQSVIMRQDRARSIDERIEDRRIRMESNHRNDRSIRLETERGIQNEIREERQANEHRRELDREFEHRDSREEIREQNQRQEERDQKRDLRSENRHEERLDTRREERLDTRREERLNTPREQRLNTRREDRKLDVRSRQNDRFFKNTIETNNKLSGSSLTTMKGLMIISILTYLSLAVPKKQAAILLHSLKENIAI